MVQSLTSEASKSEDIFLLLQEIEESVRLAFLNCFLDFAGIICFNFFCYTCMEIFLNYSY